MALLNTENHRVILASRSPRRIQLMKKIVNHFETMVSNIDETISENLSPQSASIFLASSKARKIAEKVEQGIIIGADSIVVIDDEILGKPADENESFSMLRKLSGRHHTVFTGVSVIKMPEQLEMTDYAATQVKFRELENWEIKEYIQSCHPFDKAGSYGIQDDAAVFVEEIHGCYYNVVGLPVAKVYGMVKKFLKP